MGSHSLLVERYGGGKAVPIPNGGKVKPGELIRLSVTGIPSLVDPTVRFTVVGAQGKVFSTEKNPAPFSSQVVVDWAAPMELGGYVVTASLSSTPLPFPRHDQVTTFEVSESAGEPAVPPENPGLGGFHLGDIKTLALIALGIVALMSVSSVTRTLRS